MAEGIIVSVSMGVMKPLLAKLTTLMADKYKKIKGLQKEVSFLKDELSNINALLEKMDKADELDSLVMNWRKHVIEMSYDIEDCIDDFIHSVGETDHKVGILQKASHYIQTFKDRNRIASQIQEINTRVIQASERRARYKLDDCISTTTSVVIDPRLSALYKDPTSLVGIEKQKEDLVKWMMDEEEHLKVVSIVGFGGLGKTTLASEVQRIVGEQFSCKAFVSVSQKLDLIRLLISIQSQVGLQPPSYTCEVQDHINKLREHLVDKRYLVVVDDLWDVQAWNFIRCAFPQNNCHSRVIVTTRIGTVARACCSDHGCIHNVKPLSEVHSKELFFNRIFGSVDACPSQFQEISSDILKKCGGLPLAIISVASILAMQPTKIKEWEYIQNSLAAEFATSTAYEDMIHILDLSYKSLPRHLKACFLYLGIYPEDQQIGSNDLVRQWVAEGFVSNSTGRNRWDVAKSYFNELVNRNMIQPTYKDYDIYTEVLSCRVHDMMLDLIIRRCTEDNFVSVVQSLQAVAKLQDKVRRLSLNLSSTEGATMPMPTTGHLSKVRSLAIFGAPERTPPFLEFKFLRMLFLGLSMRVTRLELTGIIGLSHLRYLKVEWRVWLDGAPQLSIVLPGEIGMLQYLETLELPMRSSCRIPKDMVDLPRLSHLVVPPGTRLPDRIGKLKSLRTLDGFNLAKNSLENTEDLSELTDLADLKLINSREVYWNTILVCADNDDTPEATWMAALSSSLGKLGSLKRLSMKSFYESSSGDSLSSFSPPFRNLEHLNLSGWFFSRVPKWVGVLHNIHSLELLVKEVTRKEDVDTIGMLPSLVKLDLRIPGIPREKIVIGSTGFAVLKHLLFDCDAISYLTFEAGAMPKLRKLVLGLDPHGWDKATPVGLQHLRSLTQINVWRAGYIDTPPTSETEEHESTQINVWRTGYIDTAPTSETEGHKISEQLVQGVFQFAADALPSRPVFILEKEATLVRTRTRME